MENLLLYTVSMTLLVIMPGPDFALILKTSLAAGRRASRAVAFGIAAGLCVHTLAAILGISALIARSVTLFEVLKYVGAAYLLWLGIMALRARPLVSTARDGREAGRLAPCPVRGTQAEAGETGAMPAAGTAVAAPVVGTAATPAVGAGFRHFFWQGLLTNVLNPKAVVIFLTVLPQFIDPHVPVIPQFLLLGGILALLALFWYVFLAAFLDRVGKYFQSPIFRRRLERLTGLFLLSFGIRLALSER